MSEREADVQNSATAQMVIAVEERTEIERIRNQQYLPLMVQLAQAVKRLTSTLSLMSIGAHPDDEPSALLMALRHYHGISSIIYCITRGEGGQNSIGKQSGEALGALRTREMQAACRSLDARLIFAGEGSGDAVHDFGFSKSAAETLAHWNEASLLARMVRSIRAYRPDIVLNCFNDVAGQHGHHRAAVYLVDQAVKLAADENAFPEHFAEGLSLWQVAKVYDPAWSGGGDTYDDEKAPPPATLRIEVPAFDGITGATWAQMGEWSRAYHQSQNMGQWIDLPKTHWDLHLRQNGSAKRGDSEQNIADHLPANLGEMANWQGMTESCAQYLRLAQAQIEQAMQTYPTREHLYPHALCIAKALKAAEENLPALLQPQMKHRLARKRREADVLLALAAEVEVRSQCKWLDSAPDTVEIHSQLQPKAGIALRHLQVMADAPWQVEGQRIRLAADALPSNPLPKYFDPLGGNAEVWLQAVVDIEDYACTLALDLAQTLTIVPKVSVHSDLQGLLLNRAHRHQIDFSLQLQGGAAQHLAWQLPDDWQMQTEANPHQQKLHCHLSAPPHVALGRQVLSATYQNHLLWQQEDFYYPHIGRLRLARPYRLPVQVIEAALPDSRVAYIGAGHDHIVFWLKQMGKEVQELDENCLLSGEWREADTLIVGVFAFGKCPALRKVLPDIHQWIHEGGHLLTLYHRPSDGWQPQQTPPAFLQIGSPSIRYRVTDEKAAVKVLAPHHRLLNFPNRIMAADWEDWDKERGLYFASRWDSVYVPLLSMADKGEAALEGGLLSAQIGKGRHSHCALSLHHQLNCLTAGAFRLFANLLQKAQGD